MLLYNTANFQPLAFVQIILGTNSLLFFQENTTDSVQVVGAEFMDVISIKSTDGSGTCSSVARDRKHKKINVYCSFINQRKI